MGDDVDMEKIAEITDGMSGAELLDEADKALYEAKESGRNTIVIGDAEERRFIKSRDTSE